MEPSTVNVMDRIEIPTDKILTEVLAPDGLGFGEGGISVKKQIELGILTDEVPAHVHEVLTNDPNSFKSVETGDDGCGDGRPWVKILRMVTNGSTHEVVEY